MQRRRSSAGGVLAAAILVAAPASAAPGPAGPVAVMPFQNLAGDARVDWLRRGIGETLLTELARSGAVPVVERAQLDQAIRELDLQKARQPVEATAVQLGKLVGARSIVVGSFQESAGQLRLTARFVTVETGVVGRAATATGPMSDVFALEDKLVADLLGVPPSSLAKARARKPRKKSGPRVAEAFAEYARSLDARDDAERATYLHRALAIDPDLSYAVDDLAALEKRMAGYAAADAAKLVAREQGLYTRARDPRVSVDDRQRAARDLLDSLDNSRRWHTLLAVAPQLHVLGLPAERAAELDEEVSFHAFHAEAGLRHTDAALQLGEQHLARFPGGTHTRLVDEQMHDLIDARRKQESRRAEYLADVAEKRKDLAGTAGVPPAHRLEYDYAPCIAARWNSLVGDVMLDACNGFVGAHQKDADPEAREKVRAARFFVTLSLAAKGDFAAARPMAEALLADADEWRSELRAAMATWPAD